MDAGLILFIFMCNGTYHFDISSGSMRALISAQLHFSHGAFLLFLSLPYTSIDQTDPITVTRLEG
jgi:hypothetical protein